MIETAVGRRPVSSIFSIRPARRCQANQPPGLRSAGEVRRARRPPGNRAQKLAALDTALELAARATRDAQLGQASLFGDGETQAPALAPKLPGVAAPTTREMLGVGTRDARDLRFGPPARRGRADRCAAPGATPVKELRDVARRRAGDDRRDGNREPGASLTKTGQQISSRRSKIRRPPATWWSFRKRMRRSSNLFENDAILMVKGTAAHSRAAGRVARRRAARRAVDCGQRSLGVRSAAVAGARRRSARLARQRHGSRADRPARAFDRRVAGEVPVVMHVQGRSQRVARAIAGDARVRRELERIFAPQGVREGALDAYGS